MLYAELKTKELSFKDGQAVMLIPLYVKEEDQVIETHYIDAAEDRYALSDLQVAEEAVSVLASRGYEVLVNENDRKFTLIDDAAAALLQGVTPIGRVDS